ncbi:MAG TPA: hypothetical protein VF597_00550 [Candidatus Saccharimonadales bacterium]|jgi:hypothetical protein
MKTVIRQPITVSSVSFGKDFAEVPRRIEFDGRTINFVDMGLRYCIRRGEQVTRLFDLSDGQSLFRLRQDSISRDWSLLSITS